MQIYKSEEDGTVPRSGVIAIATLEWACEFVCARLRPHGA